MNINKKYKRFISNQFINISTHRIHNQIMQDEHQNHDIWSKKQYGFSQVFQFMSFSEKDYE